MKDDPGPLEAKESVYKVIELLSTSSITLENPLIEEVTDLMKKAYKAGFDRGIKVTIDTFHTMHKLKEKKI